MPVLNTAQELANVLGGSALSADPIANLANKGFTLSPALNAQYQAALGGKQPPPIPAGLSNFKGQVSFAPAVPVVPNLPPPGTYDVVAGVSLSAANLALAKLYESGSIPHQLALDQLLPPEDLNALGGFFKVDKPGGQISRLHITSAPTLAEIADGNPVIKLAIPIQIDWIHTRFLAGRQVRQFITDAVGTLTLTMELLANISTFVAPGSSTMTIELQLVKDPGPAESPRLTLNPDSPVQLTTTVPPDRIDGTATIIQAAIAQHFQGNLIWPVSPYIALPIGTVQVRQADVRTIGGALIAGMCLVGINTAQADPSNLSNLLPAGDSNVFFRVHGAVVNLLLQNALQSGALTEAAKQQQPNAVINSGSATFQGNSIVVQLHGTLINECPFNTDLGFTYTRTITIGTTQDGSLDIVQSDSHSLDVGDSIVCLLTTLGIAGLIALYGACLGVSVLAGFVIFAVLVAGLTLAVELEDLLGHSNRTIVDLTLPVPGTDYLPAVTEPGIQIANGAMLVTAAVGLVPDNVNAVLYARFLGPEPGLAALIGTVPLVGVTIELMNQNVPKPAGDDLVVLVPPDTSWRHGSIVTTQTHSYVPPTSDARMAEAVTDLDGIVRFGLLASQVPSSAGAIKTVTTHLNLDTGQSTSETSLAPYPEAKPDLYFRVTLPNGKVLDTKNLPGGFMLNFDPASGPNIVGSLANPATFVLGVSGVLEAGTGG